MAGRRKITEPELLRIILPFISFVVSDRATYCGTRNTEDFQRSTADEAPMAV